MLNFSDQTRTGAFMAVWSVVKAHHLELYLKPSRWKYPIRTIKIPEVVGGLLLLYKIVWLKTNGSLRSYCLANVHFHSIITGDTEYLPKLGTYNFLCFKTKVTTDECKGFKVATLFSKPQNTTYKAGY